MYVSENDKNQPVLKLVKYNVRWTTTKRDILHRVTALKKKKNSNAEAVCGEKAK